MNAYDTETVVRLLRDEQERRCAYATRDGDGRTCDCKYGAVDLGARGERTGCPELRAAIRLLEETAHPDRAARDQHDAEEGEQG
jgi:hypothetical protein